MRDEKQRREIFEEARQRLQAALDEFEAWAQDLGIPVHGSVAGAIMHFDELEKAGSGPDRTAIAVGVEDTGQDDVTSHQGAIILGRVVADYSEATGVPVPGTAQPLFIDISESNEKKPKSTYVAPEAQA